MSVKSHAAGFDNLVVGSTWGASGLDPPNPGGGSADRVGSVISMSELSYTVFLEPEVATSPGGGSVRIVFVLDKQSNGSSVPTALDVMRFHGIYSTPNWDNKSRFKILYDVVIDANINSMSALSNAYGPRRLFHIKVPLGNRKQVYPMAITSGTYPLVNAVFVMFIANTTVGNLKLSASRTLSYVDA